MPFRRLFLVALVASALGLASPAQALGDISPPIQPWTMASQPLLPRAGIVHQSSECGTITPVLAGAAEKTGASTVRARQGASFRLVFKSQYKTCTGKVVVKQGKRTIGKPAFKGKRAVFRFPRDLKPGKYAVTFTFRDHSMKLWVKILRKK